ncbi:MAG: hypothetical protein B7Z73_04025 [Planctomycetia bacterium 21-64-5]|nr:MAG: hypothetical protein B7Z73_04025 [Planctomycetia bacterium 21-64-5]HQU42767.1 hypothetical protein [Pirellulales bacterium]
MNAIKAVWTHGQIVPAEPVDWPEGSELVVEPIAHNGANVGLTDEQWRDDPDSIAAWIAAVEQIEPLIWADGEEEEQEHYRANHRQLNIDAVRMQMERLSDGDTP